MDGRDERIANLASTLKASGIAKSEAQARMMAEEMIGVEENVQKRYDAEHSKAHEFLKTAKHLGEPRTRVQEPKVENVGEQRKNLIHPIPEPEKGEHKKTEQTDNWPKFKAREMEPVHTDVNFGSGSLKDLMLNQIKEDKHEIKAIEDTVPEIKAPVPVQTVAKEAATQIVNPPNDRSGQGMTTDITETSILDEVHDSVEELQKTLENMGAQSTATSNIPKDEENNKRPQETQQGLDPERLRNMMEEDGPLQEHTREIKEKPKDAKPKEEYVENSIDLSNMFNVNKK